MVKFYRGPAASFDKTAHKDGLYFATDMGEIYLNDSVYGSEYTVTDVTLSEDGTALTVSYREQEAKEINLVELLAKATETAAGLMSSDDKKNLDALFEAYSNDELGKVQGVSETDKVLSLGEDKLLSATVSLSYENETIKLLGKDNVVLGEVPASDFIKDGMLQDVEIVEATANAPVGENTSGKYIVFTWNVLDGEEVKTDFIAVSELAKTYVNGTAINIGSDNSIGVVIAEGTNYLKDDNGLKVSEMGTDVTLTTSEIPVAGGPLASYVDDVYPDGIPVGTSIQDILMKLICKEIFPTPATSQGSLSTSMSLTTVALSPTDTTLEVGTIVTTNELTATGSSVTETAAKISGLTYGYSATEEGDVVTGNKTFELENVTESSNTHKITLAYSGFTETAPSAASGADTVTMPSQSLVVREGACKVTASATGSTFTATSPSVSDTYYLVSNIKTRKEITTTIASKSLSATASKSTNDSVTGVYKYFVGYYDFASNQVVEDVFTSDIIRGLSAHTGNITKDGTTTVVGTTSVTSDGKSIVVAVPSKYKLATFQNDLGGSEIANFSKTGTVAVANPTNADFTTNYTVYVWPVAGGATITYKNVTITKA